MQIELCNGIFATIAQFMCHLQIKVIYLVSLNMIILYLFKSNYINLNRESSGSIAPTKKSLNFTKLGVICGH